MVVDSGGRSPRLAGSVVGAQKVAALLAAVFPGFFRAGITLEPRELNGHPGAIFRDRDGRVTNTWTLDVLGGRIQTIRSMNNPDKLGHVGPVADAWALLREVRQADAHGIRRRAPAVVAPPAVSPGTGTAGQGSESVSGTSNC